MSQQFCLKWNNHMNNMMDVFKNLLSTESMVDVTLACDGLSLKAHKMVLSACSPFFQALFLENPCQHPIVILKDMKYTELKAIIEFMYHGEVNVAQDQLSALMKTAETLRVKGLAEVTNEKGQTSQEDSRQSHTDTPPPHSKRRKVRNRKRSLSGSDYSDSNEREPKIKQPTSPDIEELSGDISMDNSRQFQNVQQSRVPLQSHSSNSYHKTSSVASSQDLHMEGGASENESEFGVEPAKLLQQTLTTEEARRSRLSTLSSSSEPQRRPKSSTDHSMGMSIVPTPLASDETSQQPASPPDIKPELLELDPPVSPVAGPSHSNENAMVVYGDAGPSYQDDSALISQDSQQQQEKKKFAVVKFSHSEHVEVIPISWLINNEQGKWPPAKKSTVYLRKCIRESAKPEDDWQTLDLKVYCLSETLKCANKLAQAAFDASIIEASSNESTNSCKRLRIKPIKFRDNSSEEEDITKIKCTQVSSMLNVNQISEMNDSAKMLTMMTKVLNQAKDTKDELKHLRNEVKEMRAQQIQLLNKETHVSTPGLLELPRGIEFPLSSDADLIQLDQKLKEDKNLQSVLIRYFDCICSGRTISGFLLSICRKFLTKDLAMQYSRLGRKGKKCFESHSAVTNVILAIVLRRFEANRQEIAEKFGKALAQAVDWDGRHKIIEVSNSLDLESEECVQFLGLGE